MNDTAPWLERELARQLAPVAAPESLWNRIHEPRRSVGRGDSFRWTVWPAVALLTLLVCAGVFRTLNMRGAEELSVQELAELAKNSKDFDFRSSDFGAIRSWVKAESNIDIDLSDESSAAENASVRVLGVRLIRFRGLPVAAIDYRVGDDFATLLVSGKRADVGGNSDVGKHLFRAMKSAGNTRLVSWNMRNQNYAVAFTGGQSVHGACLLCHANMPGLIAIN